MRVLFVYPEFPDTFWSFKHALKFVNRKVTNPPLGLMTIAPLLPTDWEKKLIDLNIDRLTDRSILWADLVMISAMDVQRASVHQVVQHVKQLGKPIIAGGPLFTGDYASFPEIDTFILNEGEITIPQFLADFESGRPLKHVYESTEYADIRQSPLPDLSLINLNNYDSMSIQYSRGCPFHCDFCNVTALLGHVPRVKSAEQVIAELDQLYAAGWRRNVFFVDDNLIGNKRAIKQEILPALIEWRKDKIGCKFTTEASINMADDPELMKLMADAGFINIFIGIESPEEASLEECRKSQNTSRDLLESIKSIQNHGMQVMAGFIVGFDHDTSEIFERMINFIQASGIVTAMVGLLQAPFGTTLYRRLKDEGRILKEMSGDNADGTTNILTKMNPDLLREGYFKIMSSIYSPKLLYPRIKTFLNEYNPLNQPVKLEQREILAFIRTIFRMGFNHVEARHYWDLLLWTIKNDVRKFPMAVTLTIYGFHFRTITKKNTRLLSLT